MKKRPGMAHSFKKLETSHTGILSPMVSVLSLFLISIFHLSLSHSRTRGYYWSESNTMGRCQKRNFGWDQLSKFLLNEKMRTKTFFSTSSCDVIGSNKRPSGDIVGPDNCSHFWTAPKKFNVKRTSIWAVIVAQLVERLLPTAEVRGLNPVISKFLMNLYCQLYWKDTNK